MVLHTTYVLRVPYSCGVVFSFLVRAGNGFRCFVRMVLIVQYSCVVVSVFGSGRKYTLLLYIPLLALTDRQTDRDSNTLTLGGLEEPFFQLYNFVLSEIWRALVPHYFSGGLFWRRLRFGGNWFYIIFWRIVFSFWYYVHT